MAEYVNFGIDIEDEPQEIKDTARKVTLELLPEKSRKQYDVSYGTLHTPPSVIVAKIMEKLRERERENIPPSSVASAPAVGNIVAPAPTPPTAAGKFSRAARRVLTRTTVLGALPFIARQQQQSVLTPDNRRFLDSQGSKSPDVPRKRMIIGHRSYTFGCDGDLIELEPISPTTPTPNFPPKPKPLVHKDSILSTATSLSLTSIDSDSDTDDHSSSFGIQQRRNIILDHIPTSTPKSPHFSSSELSQDSPSEKHPLPRVYPSYPIVSKRMSSTSLSSWESEAIMSPIHSFSDVRVGGRHRSTDEAGPELQGEEDDGGIKTVTKHHSRFHSNSDSPLSASWPMRYESIDEDIEMRSDQSASLLSTSTSEQSQDVPSKIHHHDKYEGKQTAVNNGDVKGSPAQYETVNGEGVKLAEENLSDINNSSSPADEQTSTKTPEQQAEIQKQVISLLQLRRSSLKRQQRVLDDEEESLVDTAQSETEPTATSEETSTKSLLARDEEKSSEDEYMCYSDVFIDEAIQSGMNAPVEHSIEDRQVVEQPENENNSLGELSSNDDFTKEQAGTEIQLNKCAEDVVVEPQNSELLRVVCEDARGDSFEMEEICTYGEEEGRVTMLSRARSDSSGFLDGDSEIYSRHNGHAVDGTVTNLESSQHDGSSGISSDVVQDSTSEMFPQGFEEPSQTLYDTNKSKSVISVNVSDYSNNANSGSSEHSADKSSASLNEQRSEIGLGAIGNVNLPNNLLQELSSVHDWVGQCVPEPDGSCAILHSLTNCSAAEKQSSCGVSTSNKTVSSGQSAINPELQNLTDSFQDGSLDRTLLGQSVSVFQPPVCNDDDKELVRQRTMSLHGINTKGGLLFSGVRRVRSAPHCLENLASGDEMVQGSSWSSVSNMFSFCSDESVIHVGVQRSGQVRTSEKRSSDVGIHKPEVNRCESGHGELDTSSGKIPTDSTGTTQYLKPSAVPYGRNTRRSSSDGPVTSSSHSVKDLHELVGELAGRGWDITMGTDSSHFACHTDQQLLRLQGDAVRAGLAAYGRQLVGGQAEVQNGSHEVAEANKELEAVGEVRDRIAAELRRVADLLEEQPPHKAANITGQMAVLLREQTRLCRQLENLSGDSSPSISVEPAPCCSVLDAVREENRRLQDMVEKNSQDLKEIRQLLKELVNVKNSQY